MKRMAATLEENDWVVIRGGRTNDNYIWEGPYEVVMKTDVYIWVMDKDGRFVEALNEDVIKVVPHA